MQGIIEQAQVIAQLQAEKDQLIQMIRQLNEKLEEFQRAEEADEEEG